MCTGLYRKCIVKRSRSELPQSRLIIRFGAYRRHNESSVALNQASNEYAAIKYAEGGLVSLPTFGYLVARALRWLSREDSQIEEL
jgi:hypothetical protein